MMKGSTQNSATRRSKKETHPQLQLKRKTDKIVAKSLNFADPNSPEEDLSEVVNVNSPESTQTDGFTPESSEKTEDISSVLWTEETYEVAPDSSPENSPISVTDSTVTVTSPDMHTNNNDGIMSFRKGDVEAEMIVDYLGKARLQMSKARSVDRVSKRVFDAVIQIAMEEYCGEKRCSHREVVWLKVRIGLMCFLLVALVLFINSRSETSCSGPCPT